jgi:AraC-like DNA-binding protein
LSFETDENKQIAKEIVRFFEENKPFLNPDFEFYDLQKALDLSEEELKISMKYILKKKFTELRSEYRINYAKDLIKSGLTQTTSIDGIGTMAGFSNRANFYSTFKLLSGLTPSQYLQSLKAEKTKNN